MWRGGFRLLSHTADTGFETWGESLAEVYARAAEALFQIMGWPDTFAPGEPFEIVSRGVDPEDLLVRLLSDLLARFEIEGSFVRQAHCDRVGQTADGDWEAHLTCDAGGVDRETEQALTEIKAVTYHGLEIWEEDGLVRARVFLDV